MVPAQILRVGQYILQLLRGEVMGSSELSKPLTQTAYIGLSPSIWALLNGVAVDLGDLSAAVLHATIDHSIRTSCKAAMKMATIDFIGRLVLVRVTPAQSCVH